MEKSNRLTSSAHTFMQRVLRYRGLMVLVLWQAAPIRAVRDESGTVRLRLGYGFGQYEDASFDCDGRLVSADPVRVQTVGADVEAWPTSNVRLTGAAGYLSSRGPWGPGGYGGALLAREGRVFGFGLGALSIGDHGGAFTAPSAYLRIGRRERAHFRFDFMTPEMTLGSAGLVRAGIGFNSTAPRAVSGMGGLALCHFCTESSNASGFLALDLPVSRAVGLDLRGLWGPGHNHANFGLSIAGRVATGTSTRADPHPVMRTQY